MIVDHLPGDEDEHPRLHEATLLQTRPFSAPPLHSPSLSLSSSSLKFLPKVTSSLPLASGPPVYLAERPQAMQYHLQNELICHEIPFLGQMEGAPTQGNTFMPVSTCSFDLPSPKAAGE